MAYPEIYNGSDERLAFLNNILKDTATIKRVINGEFTFAFQAYEKALKSEYFDTDNYILVENQTFDIAYIEQAHKDEVLYDIKCEHCSYRLVDGEDNQYESYTNTGTPASILTDILDGTDFTVGTVDFTDPITITVNKELSKRELIKELANTLGGELDYTNNGFEINILDSIGADNNFQIRFKKNLKSVKKIIDKRGGLKTYYQVDILALKNTNAYLEKGYSDLEVIEVGDTVRIIDSVLNLDVENRIVSLEYNPILQVNVSVEIANQIELITTKITEIETTAVMQEALYNGLSISEEDGFVAERSDGKAKVEVNATEGISVYGNSGAGYSRNLYIDTNGYLVSTGIIKLIDSEENIGIGYFSDAGDLAVLDTVNETYIDNDSISTAKIQTNAITTDKIQANSITTNEIDVDYLSGIAADMGTITAGTITGVNIYGANIEIEEDVIIGQKLKILDPNNEVSSELTSFEVLTSTGLKNSLFISESSVINNETGAYSVDYLERMDMFVDRIFMYGVLVVMDDVSTIGYLSTTRLTSGGGYVYVYNDDEEEAAILGVNSYYSYQTGMLMLLNGVDGDSETRWLAGVETTNDSGFLSLYMGDYLTVALLSAATGGGQMNIYRPNGNISASIGGNPSYSGNGYITLQNLLGDDDVVCLSTAEGGYFALCIGGDTRVKAYCDDDYGSFLYMYNENDYEVVRLGGSASANSCGSLELSDEEGNVRARLRVSTSVGDGRLDLLSAGGDTATISFNGSNLYVTIGGTSYQIDMTA